MIELFQKSEPSTRKFTAIPGHVSLNCLRCETHLSVLLNNDVSQRNGARKEKSEPTAKEPKMQGKSRNNAMPNAEDPSVTRFG